jgi:hypothetical protein
VGGGYVKNAEKVSMILNRVVRPGGEIIAALPDPLGEIEGPHGRNDGVEDDLGSIGRPIYLHRPGVHNTTGLPVRLSMRTGKDGADRKSPSAPLRCYQ